MTTAKIIGLIMLMLVVVCLICSCVAYDIGAIGHAH